MTLTLKIATSLTHLTLAHDNTPQYKVRLQMIERFRRYRLHKIRTGAHTKNDSNIPHPPSPTPVTSLLLLLLFIELNDDYSCITRAVTTVLRRVPEGKVLAVSLMGWSSHHRY